MEFNAAEHKVSEKIVKTHSIMVFVVCLIFGALNMAHSLVGLALCTMAMGVVIPLVSLVLMKDTSKIARGTFLTQATAIVIIVLSAAQGELHSMFALLVGNIAIGSVYYNVKNIQIAWALTDIVLIAALLFKDTFYVGVSLNIITKGIFGVNISAYMIQVLLKDSIKHINQAVADATRADKLLVQVKEQMEESHRLMEKQTRTVSKVANIAENLGGSSNVMLDISNRLTSASEEQANTISDIHNSIQQFAQDAESSSLAAKQASNVAIQSADMLHTNSEHMHRMLDAMQELSETSSRISGIIKTIDDISFQTNILALNAAVEAARAGTAGKGFAVVADEVRNLANKSAEAAKNTATLINESLVAVENGTSLAKTAAEQMNSVIDCSRRSEAHAKEIEKLIHHQQDTINGIKSRMASVSEVITSNTQTAFESAEIARTLSEEVERMNNIVADRN